MYCCTFTFKQNGRGGQRELPTYARKLPPRHTAPTSFGWLSQKNSGLSGCSGERCGFRGRGRVPLTREPFRPQDSRREGTEPSSSRLVVVLFGEVVQRDAL